MSMESCLPWRCRPSASAALAVACLAVWSVAFPPVRAEAASLVIPAWSFARGNMKINADPDELADAGPIVVSGAKQPWAWTVEYDVDIPVVGELRRQGVDPHLRADSAVGKRPEST